MAISSIIKTKRDGTLTFSDGTRTLTVQYEQGDLQIDIPGATIVATLDRGEFGSPPSLRKGDDQPITGSFTAYLRDISDASYATLEEMVTNGGYYASTHTSTLGANAEVKTQTLLWTIEGTNHGDSTDHTVSLPYVWVTGGLQEGEVCAINVSFTSYAVYPTVT